MASSAVPVRTLFWGSGSSWAWRVQLTLAAKGLDYEAKRLRFELQEHKSAEMLALNPRGQVPVFIDGDIVICESGAACEYLESTNPSPALIPSEKKAHAAVLQRMYEATVFGTAIMDFVVYQIRHKPAEQDPDLVAAQAKATKGEALVFEKYFEGRGSEKAPAYLVGDSYTMADVFFFPMVATAVRWGADLDQMFPNLAKYYKHMSVRKDVSATWPPHWKESPSPSILRWT